MMKKLLSALACVMMVAYANAQGTVNFGNSAANTVKFSNGTAVPIAQFSVGLLYWASDPGAVNFDTGSLSLANLIKTSSNFILPGRFIGGTATTPNTTAGGTPAWFAVIAWQSSYASYDACYNAGGQVGWTLTAFQNPTGDPNKMPTPDTPATLSGFVGINNVHPVPEPTTMALGLLGVAALLLRRRK